MWAVLVDHPAVTFPGRQPALLGPLSAHVANYCYGAVRGLPPLPKLYLSPRAALLEKLIRRCKEKGVPMAVDIEARPPRWTQNSKLALMTKYAVIRAIGVGAKLGPRSVGMSWMYPLPSRVRQVLEAAFADPTLAKVWCNGRAYDRPVMARHGFSFAGRQEDIKERRRVISSTSLCGLGPQVALYRLAPPWKVQAQASEKGDDKGVILANIPRKKLLKYNALDCAYTAEVDAEHRREFRSNPKDTARLKRLYEHQLRLAEPAADMMHRGFPVDLERRAELEEELLGIARVQSKELARLLKPFCKVKILEKGEKAKPGPYFRITMSGGVNENDLRSLLFREARRKGLHSFELEVPWSDGCRTEDGSPSVRQDALLHLWAQDSIGHELKQIIRQCWKTDAPLKANSTFVSSKKLLARIGPDKRLHPNINSCGTETGRWSSQDWNFLNLPEAQKEEDGSLRGDLPSVRGFFCAGDPDYVIVHRDWSGIELEVMAEVTGDTALREMLDSPHDVHSMTLLRWFKQAMPVLKPGEKLKDRVPVLQRRQAKVVRFACQYHAGLETVFIQVLRQLPESAFEDVELLYNLFPEEHPGIAAHWRNSLRFAQEHGHNETGIMQRRRYYPPDAPIKDTETSNYEVQGGAGDIANCTMVGIERVDAHKALYYQLRKRYPYPTAWMANHTYDSFDVICHKRIAKDVDKLMEDCMSGVQVGGWRVGQRPARLYRSDGKTNYYWDKV